MSCFHIALITCRMWMWEGKCLTRLNQTLNTLSCNLVSTTHNNPVSVLVTLTLLQTCKTKMFNYPQVPPLPAPLPGQDSTISMPLAFQERGGVVHSAQQRGFWWTTWHQHRDWSLAPGASRWDHGKHVQSCRSTHRQLALSWNGWRLAAYSASAAVQLILEVFFPNQCDLKPWSHIKLFLCVQIDCMNQAIKWGIVIRDPC